MSLFRNEVSSDKEELEILHQQFPWIPGASNIRPTPEQIAQKVANMMEVDATWKSVHDYLLCHLFSIEFDVNQDGKFQSKTKNISPFEKRFVKNEYPYNNLLSNHYILWYGSDGKPYNSEMISLDIEDEIRKIIPKASNSTFQFVWYENPKMSYPSLYHVQVFWIRE
jgi:hypothetical protein